ncbi:MAG: hypothetical protein GVY32_01150 [Gammaproteobacteria bacterium]|jgi:hypothetical protein|nr:hypothetical protein [Gammaproteobacteria bacterium]
MTEERHEPGSRRRDGDTEAGGLTLVDLALFLWSQKFVLLIVVGLSVALALAYALGRERVYEFTTTIELGWYQSEDTAQTLEPVEAVIAKLNNSFIPTAIERWAAELEAENGEVPGVRLIARPLTDTSLVLLSSAGTAANSHSIKRLHERVLRMLANDQRQEFELEKTRLEKELELAAIALEELEDERVQRVARKRLENKIGQAQAQIEKLADSERLIERQLASLESRQSLIEARLPELDRYIEEARASRTSAVEDAGSGADGMTLMLISSSLQEDIERQAQLEEALAVNIPNERARLENQLAEARREQLVQAEQVEEFQAELDKLLVDQERAVARQRPRVQEVRSYLDSLQVSRALIEPRRSLRPVDVSSRNLLVLAAFVGLVAALLVAGLISLARAARSQYESEKRGR